MKTRGKGVPPKRARPGSTQAGDPVRVLIADSEQGFRRFIRRILERQPDLNVAGQASDAEEVVQLAQQLKPDVVLMDIDLPGLDGLEATRRIKASLPGTKVIMLSAVDGETYRNTAAKHGADGFPAEKRPGFRDPFCHPARRLGKGCAKKWLILHLVLELLSSRENPGRIRTLPRLGERRAKGPKMARKLAPGWPTRGRRSRHIAGGSGGDRPGQRAFAMPPRRPR